VCRGDVSFLVADRIVYDSSIIFPYIVTLTISGGHTLHAPPGKHSI
jgi:hypothetical protein